MSDHGIDTTVTRALDSKALAQAATDFLDQAAKLKSDFDLTKLVFNGITPDELTKPFADFRGAIQSIFGEDRQTIDQVLGILLLNSTQNALREARAAIEGTTKPEIISPPYINPEAIPQRRMSAELCPFIPLTNGWQNRGFEKGNGQANDPYIWDGKVNTTAFIQKLRLVACLTSQPFVYGKDQKGILEVAALVPSHQNQPYPGCDHNPLRLDLPAVGGADKHHDWVQELARLTAIALNLDVVSYVFSGTTIDSVGQYRGGGQKDNPRLANGGESESEFLTRLKRFQLLSYSLADWVVVNGRKFVATIFEGDGRTKDSPFISPPDRRESNSLIRREAGLIADDRRDVVFAKVGNAIQAILAEDRGISPRYPFKIFEQKDATPVYAATNFEKEPRYFKKYLDSMAQGDLYVCVPEEYDLDKLRKQMRAHLNEFTDTPAATIVSLDGTVKERILPFPGEGLAERPFRKLEEKISDQEFIINVQDYLLRQGISSAFVETAAGVCEVNLGEGAGTLSDPFMAAERTERYLLEALRILQTTPQQDTQYIAKIGTEYIGCSQHLAGDGRKESPFSSKFLTEEQLKTQVRELALVKGVAGFWFQNGESISFIEGITGSGSAEDPKVLPSDVPIDLYSEKYLQSILKTHTSDILLVKMPDGTLRRLINTDLKGLGLINDPLIFDNLTQLKEINKIAQSSDTPLVAKIHNVHWIAFPKEYTAEQRETYVNTQVEGSVRNLVYGNGELKDPIHIVRGEPGPLFYGSSLAPRPLGVGTFWGIYKGVSIIFSNSSSEKEAYNVTSRTEGYPKAVIVYQAKKSPEPFFAWCLGDGGCHTPYSPVDPISPGTTNLFSYAPLLRRRGLSDFYVKFPYGAGGLAANILYRVTEDGFVKA